MVDAYLVTFPVDAEWDDVSKWCFSFLIICVSYACWQCSALRCCRNANWTGVVFSRSISQINRLYIIFSNILPGSRGDWAIILDVYFRDSIRALLWKFSWGRQDVILPNFCIEDSQYRYQSIILDIPQYTAKRKNSRNTTILG